MKNLMRVFAVVCAIQGVPLSAQSPSWMNPAWLYQNEVSVSNPNGSSLSQFQVRVNLGSGFDFTKAQSNAADLRVTASDGVTQIPFWIESWDASRGSASIWVQVPSIPPTGTEIYLYYGNPTAPAVSNGSATFEFFDDFETVTTTQSGYYPLGSATTTLTTTQAWETSPPHDLSVIQFDSGGYSYWGYYGLAGSCSGVGLAWSNDLINWAKYTSNPLNTNASWPSVIYANATIYMMYVQNYCTDSSIVLATSTDGINFTDLKTIVAPQSGWRNQDPNLFYNTNDGLYYLYYYHGDDSSSYDIRTRSASNITDLDTAAETVVMHSDTKLAAPNMLFANNTYYLLTEQYDSNNNWIVVANSSLATTSGFTLLPGNPVLANNSACMFQHAFGTTLHNYYCRLDSAGWTLEHRSASLTDGPQQFGVVDPTKWAVSGGGVWSIVTNTQQDGKSKNVAEAQTTDRQVLYTPNYNATDYILEAHVRQITGNVSGLGVRSTGDDNLYSINLYNGVGGQLYVYSWINNPSDVANNTLASIGVGPITPYTWYRLMAKVHSNTTDLYLNGTLQGQATDSLLDSGGVALYGEAGTTAEFSNVFVRKYAPADPATTVGNMSQSGISSLTLTPSSGLGGTAFQGTVTLATAAPAGGATISLSSDNAAASVPPTVTVPQGATSAIFAVTTNTVTAITTADISAIYGSTGQTASITINPYLISIGVSPSSVLGGNPSQGTVTLFTAAPAGGALITLSSDNPVATVSPSVTVPGGSSSASFVINTSSVSASTTANLTANYLGSSQGASLTVTPVGSGWIGSGWLYRSVVTVNNPGGAQLSNYQVLVVLDSTFDFTKTAAGGADVRFTSSDGATQIPFWIESWNPSTSSATIWVNVPSIASNGTTIYMYYGNAAATTASNGNATFDFFDDFSGGTLDPTKWTASGGTWSVVSDTKPDGTVGNVAQGSTSSRQILYSSYTGTDYVLDAYGQQISGRVWGLGVRATGVANLYSINLYDDLGSGTNLYVYSWVNNSSLEATATLGATSVGGVTSQTWYKFSIRAHSSTIDIYEQGALALSVNDSSLASGGVALYGEANTVAEWSNIIVRKYAATEPTTSVGPATTPQ